MAISKSSRLRRDSLKTPDRDLLKNKSTFSLKALKKNEEETKVKAEVGQ